GDIYSLAINNKGTLKTPDIVVKADKGTTKVAGTLDASGGANPGFVETSGEHVKIADGTTIKTQSASGASGTWLIDPMDYNIGGPNADISGTALGSNLNSNNVVIKSINGSSGTAGDVNVNETVSWTSSSTLTLDAVHNVNLNSAIAASNGSVVVDAQGFVNSAGANALNVNQWT